MRVRHIAVHILVILAASGIMLFLVHQRAPVTELYNAPLLTLTDSISRYVVTIVDVHDLAATFDGLAPIRNVEVKIADPGHTESTACTLYTTDVFTQGAALYDGRRAVCLTMIDDKMLVYFLKARDNRSGEGLKSYLLRGGNIRYDNPVQLRLVRLLLASLGMTSPTLMARLKPVGDDSVCGCVMKMQALQPGRTYGVEDKSVDFLDIDAVDAGKLKFFMPFVELVDMDMRTFYPSFVDRFTVKSVLSFDMGLFGPVIPMVSVTDFSRPLIIIERAFARLESLNNFYRAVFAFYELPSSEASASSGRTTGRVPVLEQFQDVTATGNVRGFFAADTQVMTPTSDVLEGVPLQVVDTVTLTSQRRPEENGVFSVVSSASDGRLALSKRAGSSALIGLTEGEGTCYDHPEIGKLKGLCRFYGFVWDKPCSRDSECPFYQADKNYDNHRGGCGNGYCEFPMNVERKSWRIPLDGASAFCYNCLDESDPRCCRVQADHTVYPSLNGPNYAWPPRESDARMDEPAEAGGSLAVRPDFKRDS